MKGVFVRWSEIIEEFSFAVIHSKVVVEDCISREPSHLPEPTKEDCLLEREYESDPEPSMDLEELARKEAAKEQREETIWELQEERRRSTRVSKPSQKLEQYQLQKELFQEGGHSEESEDEDDEEADESWRPRGEPKRRRKAQEEKEVGMEEVEYKLEKDNQLLDKQKENQAEEEIGRSWEGDI